MKANILSFVIALAVTGVLTPLAIVIAPKIGAMDIPKDERRMHKKPIPRFGGLGIYIGVAVSLLLFVPIGKQHMGFIIGGGILVALGIVDDIRGIKPLVKLAGQIAAAALAACFDIKVIGVGKLVFPVWFSIIITIAWIVGITNAINLIDGLDGLAAGVACISCLSVAYTCNIMNNPPIETTMLAMAGAVVGFLIYNFYPAKIFMGDAGSMFLGFGLATCSLMSETPTKGTTLFSIIIPLFILALPIFDTLFAIGRRVVNHKSIFAADKGHIHHRIMAMGFGQRRTVLALYSISAVMGIAGILWTRSLRLEALLLLLVAIALTTVFLGVGIVNKKTEEVSDAAAETKSEEQSIAEENASGEIPEKEQI